MRNTIIGKEGKVGINSNAAYKYYRANAKYRNKDNVNNQREHSKIVVAFCTKIGKALVDNDGGVFIKNLGYFTVLRHPKKQAVKVNYKGGKTFFNGKTNNYLYSPSFFGFAKGRPLLNFWVMDRTFSKVKVKDRLHKKLLSGFQYKTFISTLSSLYLFKRTNG